MNARFVIAMVVAWDCSWHCVGSVIILTFIVRRFQRNVRIWKVMREQEGSSEREEEDIEQASGKVDNVDDDYCGERDVMVCKREIARN